MKIRIFRKECFWSLIGIIISLVCDYLFIKDNKWILVMLDVSLIVVLLLIFIGYFQVVIFYPTNIVLVTNFKKSRILHYSDIAYIYNAKIILPNYKTVKWIILCEKGKLNNRMNYREFLLPIKDKTLINFKYSDKRKRIIDKYFPNQKNIVLYNDTGKIEFIN